MKGSQNRKFRYRNGSGNVANLGLGIRFTIISESDHIYFTLPKVHIKRKAFLERYMKGVHLKEKV